MKKCILLLTAALFSSTVYASETTSNSSGTTLKLVTFNIRFFGLGGTMSGDSQKETRDQKLKNFLSSEFSGTDVFFFQEIVDVPRLVKNVVPKDMKCLSYSSQNQKHQHVVICAKSKYTFQKESQDNNYIIEEVSIDGIEKSRPALHTLIKDAKGKAVLRLIGVHLKAYPSESATRLQQVTTIAQFLKPLEQYSVPTVLAGDFNSYAAKDTGNKQDDNLMYSNIFKQKKISLLESPNAYNYTFRSSSNRNKLDRFWMSKSIKTVYPIKVHGPCNDERTGSGLSDPQYYYENISDHCPVSVTIKI